MKEVFIIKNALEGTYYDSAMQQFRSIFLATKYPSYEEARNRIEKFESGQYQIDKLFIKND